MARKKQERPVVASPDVELAVLRYLRAADAPDKLTRIADDGGKPILTQKAAENILARVRKTGSIRSLQEAAAIAAVGPAAVQAIVDHFARRVIDSDVTMYRVGATLIETLNANPLLGKLMLVNPVRVLTEELGYVITAEMAQKLVDAYAPSYSSMPARQDAFYDKLRKTGRGLRFIKRVTFFETGRGPAGRKTQAAGKKLRPPAKSPLPRGADVGGFDVVVEIPDSVCIDVFKLALKDVRLDPYPLFFGGRTHQLILRLPSVIEMRTTGQAGIYFELPFSLAAGQQSSFFAPNSLLLGSLGVVLRPTTRQAGGQFYVAADMSAGALRKVTLQDWSSGTPVALAYDADVDPAGAAAAFNAKIAEVLPELSQALGGTPWSIIEAVITDKVGLIGLAFSPILWQALSAGGTLKPTIIDVQVKIGDIGGRSALAVGARVDLDWGEEPVYRSYRSSSGADINSVPWFLSLSPGNFAAAANGGLIAALVTRFWREYMEGTYELRSGYELEIQALDSYDCQDGYVEMEFDVVVHTPSWLSNFYPTLTFRFTVDGQNVYVYWDQDDDCCSECASNLYPDLVDDLKERAIKTIFRLLAEGVEALLGGAVGSDEISSLEQSLMAAGDDPAAIQSTLSNAMQNLAIGFQVPNSILTYVNLTNVFAQTLLAELRVFGTMETPKFSWPDDDKYEAWIDGDMWEKGGPPRQRGRRQSYVVFPSQRQRMMALIKPPKKAGGASWLDTANDMADKVGAIVQEPEWWHINLQAETYNMVEPFFVKWEFACADPSEMVAAANGMQATVYVNPLAEGLNCKATLTLSDSFAHTVVCEKDLGWPRIKPRPGAGAPVDYFGEILDKLRMLGFTVAGEEGGKPGVKPEVDPEVRKLLIELEAMQQMKQRRRG